MSELSRRNVLELGFVGLLSACGGDSNESSDTPLTSSGSEIGAFRVSTTPQVELQIIADRVRVGLLATLPSDYSVATWLRSLNSNTGTWPDIDYRPTTQTSWQPYQHLSRLLSFAKAYRSTGRTYSGSADLQAKILVGLKAWSDESPTSTNWYYNEIAVPQALGEILLLTGTNFLSASLRTDLIAKIKKSYLPRSQNSGTNTGANRTDRAYASFLRGLLIPDVAVIEDSVGQISDTVIVVPYKGKAGNRIEGIQQDMGYHQHGPQLNSVGYGTDFLSAAIPIMGWVEGTSLRFPDSSFDAITALLLNGYQWLVRGRAYAPSAGGRKISYERTMALGATTLLPILQDILHLLEVRYPNNYSSRSDYQGLREFENRLQSSKVGRQADETNAFAGGFKYFFCSDAGAFHTQQLSVFIKTSSPDTRQPETGNLEGLKNLLLGDGSTFFYRTGNEYGDSTTNNLFPIMNWYAMPGVTAEQGGYALKPEKDWGMRGTSTLLGGLGSEQDGLMAFDYARNNVSARKSWFFMDGRMIALGADIKAAKAKLPVLTALNQCLLGTDVCTWLDSSGTAHNVGSAQDLLLNKPKWVHHGGLAYHFLQSPEQVRLSTQMQQGSWSDINMSVSYQSLSANVFLLGIVHGSGFSTPQTYAYAVSAVDDASDLPSMTPNIKILRNNATVQALKNLRTNALSAVFWTAASIADGVKVTVSNGPLTMLLQPANDTTKASIQVGHLAFNRTGTRTVTVVLEMPLATQSRIDAGISVQSISGDRKTVKLKVDLAKLPLQGGSIVF